MLELRYIKYIHYVITFLNFKAESQPLLLVKVSLIKINVVYEIKEIRRQQSLGVGVNSFFYKKPFKRNRRARSLKSKKF